MGSVVHQDRHILIAKLVECQIHCIRAVLSRKQQSISKTCMHTTVRFDQHVHCMTCFTYTSQQYTI